MDVKEAIAAAKNYARDIYAEEGVTNFGLEEVEHVLQVGNWMVTWAFPGRGIPHEHARRRFWKTLVPFPH